MSRVSEGSGDRCAVSVIIPCFNAEKTLGIQLEALAAQRFEGSWEVVIGENGSRDGSRAVIEEYRGRIPALRVADASDRPGYAHAMNVAAREARGDALLVCDADDEVAPGWLEAMAKALETHEFVACRIDIDKLNSPAVRKSHANPQADGLQKLWYPPYAVHAGSGTFGMRRSLHKALGGFDEGLPVLADTDYCIRAARRGVEMEFVPDAVVHVRYRDSVRGLFRQARTWARYNVLMYKRYGGKERIPGSTRAYFRAWRRLLRRLPRVRDRGALGSWLWQAGWQIGTFQGCLRQRIPLF